jgi:hypothetical protein
MNHDACNRQRYSHRDQTDDPKRAQFHNLNPMALGASQKAGLAGWFVNLNPTIQANEYLRSFNGSRPRTMRVFAPHKSPACPAIVSVSRTRWAADTFLFNGVRVAAPLDPLRPNGLSCKSSYFFSATRTRALSSFLVTLPSSSGSCWLGAADFISETEASHCWMASRIFPCLK